MLRLRFVPLLGAVLLASCAAFRAGPAPAPLIDPTGAAMTETAPDRYKVLFETSRGDFVVEVDREWAPLGADRFFNLVRHGFYDGVRFFRVLPDFVVQFGISGDPEVAAAWHDASIPDDPVRESNRRGTVTFATAGPDTRTTQVFINLADNARLDEMGFAPFARVAGGMDVVDAFHAGYGEGAPQGRGPSQDRMKAEGTEYLERDFPLLDHVVRARVLPE